MVDITMNIDEALELDGFETRTSVFKPNKTGTYEINLNNQTYRVKVVDIPDSEDLHAHYDFSDIETTTSTVPDLTGNGYDLTGGFTSLSQTINGVAVGEFDGSDDSVSTAFAEIPQPNQIFVVLEMTGDNTSNTGFIYDGNDTNNGRNVFTGSSDWRIFAGNFVTGGSADRNPHIANAYYDGANSKADIDGANVLSGDAGGEGLDGFLVGASAGDDNAPAKIGEILIYPQDKTGIEADIEQYLSNKWGIAL